MRRQEEARVRYLLVSASLVLALLAVGCTPAASPHPDIELTWSVTPEPPTVGPAILAFALAEASTGRPVSGAQATVEGNMTHPGMQPVFAAAVEIAPGRYQAPLELTMPGDWVVEINATLGRRERLSRQISLPGVRPSAAGS